MRKFCLIFFLFFSTSFADDDFGEDDFEEKASSKTVILRESKLTKVISINSIKVFKKLDKYFFHPVSMVYEAFSTANFRRSVANFFSNYKEPVYITNNILAGSSDKTLAGLGYFLFNSSVGMFGTADLAKELALEHAKLETADLLRLYGMPEVFFIIIFLPLTMPDLTSKPIDIVRESYIPSFNFFITFGVELISARTLEPKIFEILHSLDEELLYESYKNQRYAHAKYFKFQRSVFSVKHSILREKFEDINSNFLF